MHGRRVDISTSRAMERRRQPFNRSRMFSLRTVENSLGYTRIRGKKISSNAILTLIATYQRTGSYEECSTLVKCDIRTSKKWINRFLNGELEPLKGRIPNNTLKNNEVWNIFIFF